PPDIAHLVCAQHAHAKCVLERALFVMVLKPPKKQAQAYPVIVQRVKVCGRAVRGCTRCDEARVETDVRSRLSTIDTHLWLHVECAEDQLTFIVGGDMARSMPEWREPEAILELDELGVAGRDSIAREEIERVLADLGGEGRARYFEMPRLDVSSTLVRARVGA